MVMVMGMGMVLGMVMGMGVVMVMVFGHGYNYSYGYGFGHGYDFAHFLSPCFVVYLYHVLSRKGPVRLKGKRGMKMNAQTNHPVPYLLEVSFPLRRTNRVHLSSLTIFL